MGTKVVSVYTCDCCGRESGHSDFNNGRECGSSTLTIKGSLGGVAYDGAWGGCSHEINHLLCFDCSRALRDNYQNMKRDMRPISFI